MDYQQDLGQVSAYETYSVGDKINFAGSDWYVIKDSTGDEDYVTVMKETILTHNELGNYAITKDGIKQDAMGFYWSSTCHHSVIYGNDTYTSSDSSGCAGHNDYSDSKVKEFLEGIYINTLETSNLKEIDGYKIRVITNDDLVYNLGWSATNNYATMPDNAQVPNWVYRNFGNDREKGVYGYWTMIPDSYQSKNLMNIYDGNTQYIGLYSYNVSSHCFGVRPVINLLKSSIE